MGAGLVEIDPDDNELTLTSKGFQFLLQDSTTQIWFLLMTYLRKLDEDQQAKNQENGVHT